MNDLIQATHQYEKWLATKCKVVRKDLTFKHERMRRSSFHFLRATYFRWAQTIERICPDLVDAPKVLCVGDTHVENFGTWRDAEGRHVWGVNDFDEAAVMPHSLDLVRLVASAELAPSLAVAPPDAARAVLKGYLDGLGSPGPLLLDEDGRWVPDLVSRLRHDSLSFWDEIDDCAPAQLPPRVERLLRRSLPRDAQVQRTGKWRKGKGGGSLGRPRYVLVAAWQGGLVVREAKAMVPSAWDWARGKPERRSRILDLAFGTYRSPDPSLAVVRDYSVRRIAPDAHKLDLDGFAAQGLNSILLESMGRELGAIHAAHRRASSIIDDLGRRGSDWLHAAAHAAAQSIEADFRTWRKLGR